MVVVTSNAVTEVTVTCDVSVMVGRGSAFWQKLVIPPNSVKPASAGSSEHDLPGPGGGRARQCKAKSTISRLSSNMMIRTVRATRGGSSKVDGVAWSYIEAGSNCCPFPHLKLSASKKAYSQQLGTNNETSKSVSYPYVAIPVAA